MSGIPLVNEKCAGAFVASAIGDALGWPNEFRSSNTDNKAKPSSNFNEWQRRSGGRYWNHTEKILAGEYSDDTQMNLAVARSLLSGKPWISHLTTVELPFWLEYERGGGSALLRAANSWKKKMAPWHDKDVKNYFEAGGNGAAMRILPHVIFGFRSTSFDLVANAVTLDAIMTHGHPRAIVGALCYAYALYYLIKKESTLSFGELIDVVCKAKLEWGRFPSVFPEDWISIADNWFIYHELWNNTVEATVQALSNVSAAVGKGVLDSELETLTALGCFDKRVNGAGDVAAVASIYLASKYANNPTLGIRAAANAIGSDTDTIASMTGGLLGTICGMDWIPAEWKLVQDYDCLVLVAGFLLSENGIEATKNYVANKQNDVLWERSPIGICKKVTTFELPSGNSGNVRISKFVTALGQTFYMKKFFRKKTSEVETSYKPDKPTQNFSMTIKSSQISAIINDNDLKYVYFSTILKIFEMYEHGITDIDLIVKKVEVNEKTVKKVISFILKEKL